MASQRGIAVVFDLLIHHRVVEGGRGAKDSAKARAEEYADLLIESGDINPKTNKPYTPAEAKKFAIGLILK